MKESVGERKLRACPFCGNPDLTIAVYKGTDGFRNRYAVLCDYDYGGCGAEGGHRHYIDEAVDVWNERRRKYIV